MNNPPPASCELSSITLSGQVPNSSPPSSSPHNSLWDILAGLRFFLAAIVLASHAIEFSKPPHIVYGFSQLSGLAAVIGFLVVSGYSMAHSYRERPAGFYARRLDRIYPLYFAALVLALAPYMIWGQNVSGLHSSFDAPVSIWPLVGNAFFLQGTFAEQLSTLAPSWTLAIEAVCYLLTPLFARLPLRVLWVLIAASGTAFVFHSRLSGLYFSQMMYGLGFACLLWPWLLGFVYCHRKASSWTSFTLLVLPAALMAAVSSADGAFAAVTCAAASAVVMLAPSLPFPHAWVPKVLRYGGEISYPLYLFHYPVMVLLAGGDASRPWALYLALPLAAAVIAYHAIDLPYRRFHRRRAAKSTKQPPAPAPAASR